MSIASNKPTKPPEQPNPIVVASPELKTTVVDTRYQSLSNLLTHVEGSSWITYYYSQVLNSDNALTGQQSSGSAVVQQYKLIKNLELKVTTALQTNQDTESVEMQLTGTSNMYPNIIPNVGDMFIADVGDGREGIFRITNTTRKSIFQETCYEIEYLMVEIATAVRKGDLNQKVIETYEFVRDFILHGQNPLVQEEDFKIVQQLVVYYHQMLSRYFKMFVSKEYGTLLIPGQGKPVYDSFLTKAVVSFYETLQAPEIRNIRLLNCDDDNILNTPTIWDAIAKQDKALLRHVVKQVGKVSTISFTTRPKLEGIRYSGIDYVVYPLDYSEDINTELDNYNKVVIDELLVQPPNPAVNLSDIIVQTDLEAAFGPLPAVMIKPVTIDKYYIFSEAFYNGDKLQQSLLELSVTDYLNLKPIALNKLLMFCKSYSNWSKLEQFYYLPILLVLIKANIRGF